MIKGIVFDKDGTLLCYEEFWVPVARGAIEGLLKTHHLSLQLTQTLLDAMGCDGGERLCGNELCCLYLWLYLPGNVWWHSANYQLLQRSGRQRTGEAGGHKRRVDTGMLFDGLYPPDPGTHPIFPRSFGRIWGCQGDDAPRVSFLCSFLSLEGSGQVSLLLYTTPQENGGLSNLLAYLDPLVFWKCQ